MFPSSSDSGKRFVIKSRYRLSLFYQMTDQSLHGVFCSVYLRLKSSLNIQFRYFIFGLYLSWNSNKRTVAKPNCDSCYIIASSFSFGSFLVFPVFYLEPSPITLLDSIIFFVLGIEELLVERFLFDRLCHFQLLLLEFRGFPVNFC